jgi:hypothetical protein
VEISPGKGEAGEIIIHYRSLEQVGPTITARLAGAAQSSCSRGTSLVAR